MFMNPKVSLYNKVVKTWNYWIVNNMTKNPRPGPSLILPPKSGTSQKDWWDIDTVWSLENEEIKRKHHIWFYAGCIDLSLIYSYIVFTLLTMGYSCKFLNFFPSIRWYEGFRNKLENPSYCHNNRMAYCLVGSFSSSTIWPFLSFYSDLL